jgi:DNA-binding MarR family transcriptional regulator
LKRAHLGVRGAADRGLALVGLSLTKFGVLRMLADDPGLTGAELARRCFVTPPSMNDTLNALERHSYIRRDADPDGGRGILVTVTAAGHEMIERGAPVMRRLGDAVLGDVQGPQRAQLLAQLEQIAERAETLDAGALLADATFAAAGPAARRTR